MVLKLKKTGRNRIMRDTGILEERTLELIGEKLKGYI